MERDTTKNRFLKRFFDTERYTKKYVFKKINTKKNTIENMFLKNCSTGSPP